MKNAQLTKRCESCGAAQRGASEASDTTPAVDDDNDDDDDDQDSQSDNERQKHHQSLHKRKG